MKKENWPIVDDHGNIECPVCKKAQSPSWGDCCVHCCDHSSVEMSFVMGDFGAEEIEYTCCECSKTFFKDKDIVNSYVLVKATKWDDSECDPVADILNMKKIMEENSGPSEPCDHPYHTTIPSVGTFCAICSGEIKDAK